MNRGALTLLLVVALVLQFRCSPGTVGGGGGASETVATVTPCEQGIQVSVTGSGDFGVAVAVYHSEFTIVDTGHFNRSTVLTGSDSLWRLPVLSNSVFSIYVTDDLHGIGASFRYDNRTDVVREPQTKKLLSSGGVTGEVTITSQSNGDTVPPVKYIVVVPGSPFAASIAVTGTYTITGIPQGSYVLKAVMEQESYTQGNSDSDTVAVSGDSISIHDLQVIN